MERAGKAARAAVDSADAANVRRDKMLLLGMFVLFVWKCTAADIAICPFIL